VAASRPSAPDAPRSQARRAAPPAAWQGRILPQSVLGISALILAVALGAAFSGAVLYAYYEARTNASDDAVKQYVVGFDERLKTAKDTLDAERDTAKAEIRAELEPLRQVAASGDTLTKLVDSVAPSVWLVSTQAEDGSPAVGTAFVAFADGDQSFFLTSFATVRASIRKPGPRIEVRKGDDNLVGSLETWDEGRDLALISVRKGNLPRLAWAEGNTPVRPGDRVFAISGLGAKNASATQGLVTDISSAGIQHDAAVGPQYQGGPLIDTDGKVVGIASRTYAPLGFAPDTVWFAPLVRSSCDKVLRCPSGNDVGRR
jgi:S1-C subfamily serine protease